MLRKVNCQTRCNAGILPACNFHLYNKFSLRREASWKVDGIEQEEKSHLRSSSTPPRRRPWGRADLHVGARLSGQPEGLNLSSFCEQDKSTINCYGGNRNSKHVSAGNLVWYKGRRAGWGRPHNDLGLHLRTSHWPTIVCPPVKSDLLQCLRDSGRPINKRTIERLPQSFI